ncbi:MAG: hypothetical protein ACRCYU_24145 [Nocardioides sp.]
MSRKTRLSALIDTRRVPNALEPGGYTHRVEIQPGRRAQFGRGPEMRGNYFTKTACKGIRVKVGRGMAGFIKVSIPNRCFKTVNKGKRALFYVGAYTSGARQSGGYDELDAGLLTVRKS